VPIISGGGGSGGSQPVLHVPVSSAQLLNLHNASVPVTLPAGALPTGVAYKYTPGTTPYARETAGNFFASIIRLDTGGDVAFDDVALILGGPGLIEDLVAKTAYAVLGPLAGGSLMTDSPWMPTDGLFAFAQETGGHHLVDGDGTLDLYVPYLQVLP
jgi:hypothetical protein